MGSADMKTVLVVNPMTMSTKNVVRDVVYGCWCKGKRIGGATVPPFVLLQVASCIKEKGLNVHFIDAQAEQANIESYAAKVAESFAIVISTATMSFVEDKEYLAEIRKLNPAIKTIVFGSHPTFKPENVLADNIIDVAVRHEPYFSIASLLKAMSAGDSSWTQTEGISFRDESGKIIHNPEAFQDNLDMLPFPDVDMLPKGVDYFNPIIIRPPYITTTTSWGCPGKCTFCTAPFFDGPKVRFKTADYVIRELEYYKSKNFREIYFRDDTFFVLKARDREIQQAMIDRKMNFAWIANARVGMIDPDMMALAKKSGCHLIKFGIESGVQEILDRSKKGYKVEDAISTFKAARKTGIDTHAHVMLGMPGDTEETVKRTIDYIANELKPTTATFGICTPYPGSPLFDEVAQKCPEILDGTDVTLKNLHTDALYNKYYTSLSGDQLGIFVKKAYRKFYLRPSYFLEMCLKMKSINDIKRISIAGTKIFDFALRGDK